MNNQRKFILIAAAVGIIGTFLPWWSISIGLLGQSASQSINGFHGIGVLYFLALVGAAAIAALGDQKALLDKNMRLGAIGAGAVAIISIFIYFLDTRGSSGDSGFGVASAGVSYGFFLSALAAVAIAVIPFVIKGEGESFAGDLAALKSNVKTMQDNIATSTSATATAPPPPAPKSDRLAELEKLIAWRDEGKITEEEFEQMKSKIM